MGTVGFWNGEHATSSLLYQPGEISETVHSMDLCRMIQIRGIPPKERAYELSKSRLKADAALICCRLSIEEFWA